MPKVRSSRRVPPLKESDIDHEINLIDHSASIQGTRALSPSLEDGDTATDQPTLTPSESQRLLRESAAPISRIDEDQDQGQNGHVLRDEEQQNSAVERPPTPTVQPSTPAAEVPESSTAAEPQSQNGNRISRVPSSKQTKKHSRPKSPEKAIDILYENERGGFLCGIPLFSDAALGNLDPAPWTNAKHKPSPTNIKTAQVPDPSWEWAWPAWRVNQDDTIDTDQDGWEYSFMFSKKFSWHGPKWYNSFVRRRAWIRQRIKKGMGYQMNDPHLLNPEYFTVGSPTAKGHPREDSSVADGASNRTSVLMSDDDVEELKVEIQDIDTLMDLLRKQRIDREKLDAVQNYIGHGTDDLLRLQDYMHEIMSIFVFQASRKLLLSRLMELHDGYTYQNQRSSPSDGSTPEAEPPIIRLQSLQSPTQKEQQKSRSNIPEAPETEEEKSKLENKAKNLAVAIKHADEEVRRLEYWSDVKDMAEGGEAAGAVADDKGWEERWGGIDRSGGIGANKEELP
ncbi:meiotically up-regulated 65 protein [Seiridium cupressi]